MGLTYTSTVDRQLRVPSLATRRIGPRDVLLPLTSLVAVLAIGLAYGGRVRDLAGDAGRNAARLTNLNAVTDARELEAPLTPVFTNQSDRQVAARALFDHVNASRRNGSDVSNVGALAGAKVLTAEGLARVKPSFSVRSADAFERLTLTYASLYIAAFYVVLLGWRLRGVRGDMPLLAAAHLLTAVGFAVVLARPDPLRDAMLLVRYTEGVIAGLGALLLASFIDFRKASFLRFSYVPLVVALGLSIILLLFGDGPGNSAAKVNLGPVQPIEAIRLLLALFLAGYFARRWELLRQISSQTIGRYKVPRWIHLPRPGYVLPVLAGVAGALMLFFLQKDLGPALLLSCGFLAMYAVATARAGMALTGCGLLMAGFYAGYQLHVSTTLANRVRMWQSPWDNAVAGGDQVAQSIWALSTGGVFGTGLGFGDTRYVPAGYTDLVLAAVGEELGVAGLLVIAIVYTMVTLRGLRIALKATTDYGFFLALALTLFLIVPVVVMAAGALGVTPLTGVVTPFLSYGGSAMVANFAALGMLMGIPARGDPPEETKPFRTPTRYLGGTFAVAAVALLLLTLDIQAVRADQYVVKPHLSLQADGVRRYQYNQRVVDVARMIPRGTIFDRRDLPLATTDPTVISKSREGLRQLRAALDSTCVEPIERCYPLGGTGFHVIGDLTTRVNWGASNTSYLERDADSRLRGFSDHATSVSATDASGNAISVIRRDYRELVPLLRHRHERDHPAVKRILSRNRDLRVTLDARFQQRVAMILADYAQKSRAGKAAAVVLDADTGDLLAAASYPWPDAPGDESATDRATEVLLDRARYGLYPPGSTFKLVTAAAALRRDAQWSSTSFMCSRLDDGRVGAHIPGWSRPIRDDVLQTRPHGRIAMHDALVHSCNAYFAQLAVRLGPGPILETAAQLGIAVAPFNSGQALRSRLPQAGYGQGNVVATPLRMARVAAAIASGGVLHEVQLEPQRSRQAVTDQLLPPDQAARLGRYMRDAVLNGSGRRLKDHPWRIAGKTGTGEVSGRPSHAWFAGFAPHGSAARKIAFAVIIENAGYGGLAAAPAAGEIVTAAAAAGLIH